MQIHFPIYSSYVGAFFLLGKTLFFSLIPEADVNIRMMMQTELMYSEQSLIKWDLYIRAAIKHLQYSSQFIWHSNRTSSNKSIWRQQNNHKSRFQVTNHSFDVKIITMWFMVPHLRRDLFTILNSWIQLTK